MPAPAMIHLKEISINPAHIVDINWGDDEVEKEPMPTGVTELPNPNAGVNFPKVAVVRFCVQHNDVPLALTIDRQSDDFKTLEKALGRKK